MCSPARFCPAGRPAGPPSPAPAEAAASSSSSSTSGAAGPLLPPLLLLLCQPSLRQPLAARQPRRQVEAVLAKMREIVHIQAGQCGNQIGAKVSLQKVPESDQNLFFYIGFSFLSCKLCVVCGDRWICRLGKPALYYCPRAGPAGLEAVLKFEIFSAKKKKYTMYIVA